MSTSPLRPDCVILHQAWHLFWPNGVRLGGGWLSASAKGQAGDRTGIATQELVAHSPKRFVNERDVVFVDHDGSARRDEDVNGVT